PFCFDAAAGQGAADGAAEGTAGSAACWITAGTSGLLKWPARSDPARPEWLCVGPPETVSPGLGAYLAVGAGASADGRVLAVPDGSYTTVIHRERPEQRLKLGAQFDV